MLTIATTLDIHKIGPGTMINPLGALGPRRFLREYWQRKPLLVRAAMQDLERVVDRAVLISLAGRDDVESRLIVRAGRKWQVQHGPFRRRDFAQLPLHNWTLLVNGVENFVPAVRALQQSFAFISHARLDDVMISYAAPGGSVGPHFDSYDVFLVQGVGSRVWQLSGQHDLAFIDGAPLRMLRDFAPQESVDVAGGDLLYVPARYAHNGIAVDESITWSFGCRTPTRHELFERLLEATAHNADKDKPIAERNVRKRRHSATIDDSMLRLACAELQSFRWSRADVLRCLGEYLSEPRANLVFSTASPLGRSRFACLAAQRGLALDLKTRMLTHGSTIFINGESVDVGAHAIKILQPLADDRVLSAGAKLSKNALDLVYGWYRAGYIKIRDS